MLIFNLNFNVHLETDTTLGLLITTEFERLATFQDKLMFVLANGTFKTQDDLLSGLGFLVENGFGLTTITGLFAVITTLSLSEN